MRATYTLEYGSDTLEMHDDGVRAGQRVLIFPEGARSDDGTITTFRGGVGMIGSRLEVPVMSAVGAAFDFHAGRISQAPPWMQDRGLEWTYRIAQEPRRLLPRYLYYNPAFLRRFSRQLMREKFRRRGGSGP